jgi:O-antigen/teichoic acid export membrane protein
VNPIKQLFGQTAVYGFGTVVPRLLNYLLLTPFFTRVFDLGEYGVVTELYAYVVFLNIILTYGMETGFFRYAQLKKDARKVFSTSVFSLFMTSSAFIVMVIIFSDRLARLLDYADHPEYMIWIGLIVGIDAFTSVPFARLRWENKALKFAVIRIISVLVNIGLNFTFLYFLPELSERQAPPEWIGKIYDPGIGVGYVFISNLAASLVSLVLLSGTITSVKPGFDADLWKRMLVYSFPLLIAGLAGTINEALDRVLLKHLLPDPNTAMEQLGIYGANYKIAVLMTLFIQMFRYAGEPFYFGKAEEKGSRELFAQVMKYFVIAGMFIFLTVVLYLDVFKYFIGNAFHVGLHIVPVVLFANLLLGIFFNLSIWYKLNNLTKYGALITMMGAVITFMVNWFLIPVFGYTASAWAHVACYASMVLISWSLGRKHYRIPYPLKDIGLYMGAGLFIYLMSEATVKFNVGPRLILNSGMLAGFTILVVLKERKKLQKLSREYYDEGENR